MKTIVISGAYSNIGKTSMAEEMLRSMSNWSALKVTVKKGSICPRNSNCNVCSNFKGDFDIITDRKIIEQRGTDTARLKRAGAKKVVWLKATSKGLKKGLKKTLSLLNESEGIVIEGTSVLKFVKPDLAIHIKGNNSQPKEAAKYAETKADIIVDVDR